MRITHSLSGLLLLTTTLHACGLLNCEKGKGAVVQLQLPIAAFHGIVVEGSLEVHLTHADAQRIEAEGQGNLIGLINTEVKNGVWHIGTKKCYSTDKPLIVHIATPTLDRISVHGSGDVKGTDTFTMDELKVDVQGSGELHMVVVAGDIHATVAGSGDIELNGTSGNLNASVAGSGNINAGGLSASRANAEVAGSGDITVHAVESLDANIAGSGDINYRGNPGKVDKNIAGSGDIKHVE